MSWRLFEGLASRRMINAIGFCNWHIIYGQASLIIRIRSVGPAAVDASTAATADGDRNGVGDGDGVELQTVVAGQSYFNKSSSFAAALLSASAKDIKQGQGEG